MREIAAQGGLFALGLSPDGLNPPKDTHPELCRDTIEVWAHHYDALRDVLGPNEPVGWSSDWNGWVSHAEPVYGRRRCRDLDEIPASPLPLDTEGMAHPGMIPQHFERLATMGVDLAPLDAASERFLQMWERVRGER